VQSLQDGGRKLCDEFKGEEKREWPEEWNDFARKIPIKQVDQHVGKEKNHPHSCQAETEKHCQNEYNCPTVFQGGAIGCKLRKDNGTDHLGDTASW